MKLKYKDCLFCSQDSLKRDITINTNPGKIPNDRIPTFPPPGRRPFKQTNNKSLGKILRDTTLWKRKNRINKCPIKKFNLCYIAIQDQ